MLPALEALLGATPSEFLKVIRSQKNRMMGLSGGESIVTIYLPFLIQYQSVVVMYRGQIDRRADRWICYINITWCIHEQMNYRVTR